MFEPPVSTPISRITASEASRIRWYSLSVSVCAGATVIESPVWTPIGSKFSIEQMITTLSSASRITSISYSFQPMIDSSISTCVDGRQVEPAADQLVELVAVVGDRRAAAAQREAGPHHARQADLVAATRGLRRRCGPSRPRQTSRPIFSIACLNRSRLSALSITSALAPIISTPYFSSTPCRAQVHRQVEARLPAERRQQRVGPLRSRSPWRRSPRSAARCTCDRPCAGSVMIVAGFELTSTTS